MKALDKPKRLLPKGFSNVYGCYEAESGANNKRKIGGKN